jgi:FdrA protein
LIVVKAESEDQAQNALRQVDELMSRKRQGSTTGYRPKSLAAANKEMPQASWVLISVPGRYAARVAKEALDINKNVFLYSDNVPLIDELALKKSAREKSLLMMGPDCGTAIIGGVGLGFANKVRRGSIGLIGASGTGLQAITSEIHRLGGGISQAIGTGGRDLNAEIGGITALQALELLANDSETEVIVLVSKPPAPAVVSKLLQAAWACGKPIVVDLIGYPTPARQIGPLFFATSLTDAAKLAIRSAQNPIEGLSGFHHRGDASSPSRAYIRGLFAGGTIANEVAIGLRTFLQPIYSNLHMDGVEELPDVWQSQSHTVLDLGDDHFTQGRLHPMMDNDYRIRRLRQEAADSDVGVILIDLVLGEGAHPDPASELAPVVKAAIEESRQDGEELAIVAIVIGTDEDPQDIASQTDQMEEAGAIVYQDIGAAVAEAISMVLPEQVRGNNWAKTDPFVTPLSAINVGLEIFSDSLKEQGAEVVSVDWRPPAGGDDRLAGLLSKMK